MSFRIAFLTRSSRPSGAQMAWRLLQAGYELTVFVEKRSRAITGSRKGRWILPLLKLGPGFLFQRLAEAVKIHIHLCLRKFLGRKFKDPIYWSIEELAVDYPLQLHWVEDHNGPDTERLLRETAPDLGVLTNTRRIRQNILAIPRLGFLNLHLSALPRYAGLDSIFWALYHGEKEIGVTVHAVAPELDRGAIVLQRSIPVHSLDTEESLYDRALWLGTALMARAVKLLEEGKTEFTPQDPEQASYFSWPSPQDRALLRKRRKLEKPEPVSGLRRREPQAPASVPEAGASGRPLVLQIITRMTRGGAQENTLATAAYLRKLNYEVVLITGPSWGREGEILTEAIEQGLNVMIFPELVREVSPVSDIKAVVKLFRLIKRKKFAVVHTHTSKAGLLGRLAAFLCQAPLIVHTPHGHIFHSYFSPPQEKLFLLMERIAAGWCHALIALTAAEKREHLELRVGKPEMWHVIPSGVNQKKFGEIPPDRLAGMRQALGIPAKAKLVAFIGRLAPIKGPRFFVEAMPLIVKQIPDAHFLIVGDGEERPFMEQRIRDLGVADRVAWTGQKEEVAEYFALLDVLVVPSLNEGMGRVIVEAGFFAKPVIGSNVGGIPDLIQHHETGWLVTPRREKDLARAVEQLLRDPATACRLGQALKKKVSEAFTEDSMVESIERLYREMAAAK